MKYALKKGIALAGAAPFVLIAWANVALAQSITLPDPLGGQSFQDVTKNIAGFLYTDIAIPLCVIMALVGAFQLMTSAGDPEKTSRGRKTLMYAAVGFAVVLISGGLALLIQNVMSGK